MQRRRAHPDPVSCQSCRSKKLKCNRVRPCSNCATRGIACNYLVSPQLESASTINSNAELLGRIERLESLILKNTTDASHRTKRPALAHSSEEVIVSSVYQKRDKDLQLLENIGISEDSLLHSLPSSPIFRIRSTHEILKAQTPLQGLDPVIGYSQLNNTTVTLPTYQVAALLFDNFEANLDHLCRILHNPSIRSLMKTFYLRVGQGEAVHSSQAALFLSISALSVFFYQPSINSEVSTTEHDAVYLSKFWGQGALSMLDYSQKNTPGTLEDIQAYILMTYVTYHIDGFSARGRLLSTIAASLARDLRLHRLDSDNGPPLEYETNACILIDREVKRRVFWHITATDWLLSTLSGPQEGTYFIHPNHIDVILPKDCNDDEIILDGNNEPAVVSQPSSMAFFLARVRLAHLCRELTDTVPLETSKLTRMPYEHIIALDKKLEDFLSSLPFFFRLDAESREKSKPLEVVYPKIPIMRYCITTAAHSRRCRLHQRFLLRQSSDPRYAYSRQACLESARAVIQIYDDPQGGGGPSIAETARMGMAAHYTHLALVVMVMDLCFNRDEADRVERETEVKAALQTLEGARHISPLLDRSLNALHEILRKHKVTLPDLSNSTAYRSIDLVEEPGPSQPDPLNHGLGIQDSGLAPDASVDEFWQAATQGQMDLGSVAWDNLFSALDTRPF